MDARKAQSHLCGSHSKSQEPRKYEGVVAYKLISKVLANRLKKILPIIIDESQSAFAPGRLITYNILVSFENFHYLNHKNAMKRGSMAIKLDMCKAYDRVEWGFLETMMRRMGFPDMS